MSESTRTSRQYGCYRIRHAPDRFASCHLGTIKYGALSEETDLGQVHIYLVYPVRVPIREESNVRSSKRADEWAFISDTQAIHHKTG